MRSNRTKTHDLDALDLAAIWPCFAQGPGLPLVETALRREPERSDEVDGNGIS